MCSLSCGLDKPLLPQHHLCAPEQRHALARVGMSDFAVPDLGGAADVGRGGAGVDAAFEGGGEDV